MYSFKRNCAVTLCCNEYVCVLVGSTAEQKGLQVGDELLQVQDSKMQGLSRLEALTILKGLPDGSFTIIVRRKASEQN